MLQIRLAIVTLKRINIFVNWRLVKIRKHRLS